MERDQVKLTRGCYTCIKARRKCSRTLPQCQRCTAKSLTCRYKNQPAPPGGDLPTSSNSKIITGNTVRRRYDIRITHKTSAPLSLDHQVLESPKIILPMDFKTATYLKENILQLPKTYIVTGGTMFIHPKLYQLHPEPPVPLDSAYSLCALFYQTPLLDPAAVTTTTRTILHSIKTAHTFTANLACLQSLILLQILTLYTASTLIPPYVHQLAMARQPLLRSLTHKLYGLVPELLPTSMPPYQAWILGESCRRTLHIAHIVLGLAGVLTTGTFTLTLFVEALPLDSKATLWDEISLICEEGGVGTTISADLISYRELVDDWDRGATIRLTLFEEMLIASCKGIENVKPNYA